MYIPIERDKCFKLSLVNKVTLPYFADVKSIISGYQRFENETRFQSLSSAAWTRDKFSLQYFNY